MLLGRTAGMQEANLLRVKRRMRLVTLLLLVLLPLPLLSYMITHWHGSRAAVSYGTDIQEPVAKVVAPDGVGTAFLVSPTILLTARHVLGNLKMGDQVSLFFEKSPDKQEVKAKVRYIAAGGLASPEGSDVNMDDFLTDVAVLELPAASEITPLQLGESDGVSNLEEVVLVGYPNADYSITSGKINSDKYQGLDLFKLDAAANPGNSGGPCILRMDNTVIGVLVWGRKGNQGENIALKIDQVKKIMQTAHVAY